MLQWFLPTKKDLSLMLTVKCRYVLPHIFRGVGEMDYVSIYFSGLT